MVKGENMNQIIIDGNAIYEVDEACMREKKRKKNKQPEQDEVTKNQPRGEENRE